MLKCTGHGDTKTKLRIRVKMAAWRMFCLQYTLHPRFQVSNHFVPTLTITAFNCFHYTARINMNTYVDVYFSWCIDLSNKTKWQGLRNPLLQHITKYITWTNSWVHVFEFLKSSRLLMYWSQQWSKVAGCGIFYLKVK